MSILDNFDTLEKNQDIDNLKQWKRGKLYADTLLRKGGVKCFSVTDKVLLKDRIESIIKSAHISQELKDMTTREILLIDCRYLCKGDAYGFLSKVADNKTNPIVIIENINRIPDEDAIHDNPVYVANLLVHSWKNEDIYAGDIHIDRRGLTVILTSLTEGEETLVSVCRQNSYACCGGFDKWINTIEETAVKNAEKEYNDYGISNLAEERAE